MNENQNQNNNDLWYGTEEQPPAAHTSAPALQDPVEENVLAGIVGAFLFSLAGGILWFVLSQLGVISALSGLVGVVAAIKGYSFFAKKESLKGIVISVIIATIVIVIAWYLCFAFDLFSVYNTDWYPEDPITYADAVWNAHLYLAEPEIGSAYIGDLLFGVVFGLLGCIQPVRVALARAKRENA